MTPSNQALDENIVRQTLHGYREAYRARDVRAMLEFFADDAEVTLAPGRFRGVEEIRQVFDWDVRLSPTVKIRDTGIAVVVHGNIAVSERVVEATAEGIPYECPVVTVFELDDDGKIKRMRSYYDKLAIEQQLASGIPGVKGWIAKRVVDYLVAQGEKGLRQTPRDETNNGDRL